MFGAGSCKSGLGGWLLMIGFWGAVLGAVLWAVTRLFPTGDPPRSAEQLLDSRLAAGEIDPDTYRKVRHELVGAGRQ
jgi:uncharacterized membrane protein